MKNIFVKLLIFLLVANSALAQTSLIARRNDAAATNLNLTNGGPAYLAVDQKGILFVSLSAGSVTIGDIANITTSVTPGVAAGNLGKAEDAAHVSGDTGVAAWAVARANGAAALCAADDYCPIGVSTFGAVNVGLDKNFRENAAANAIKAEDEASNNSDGGVSVFGVANAGLTSKAADGDYLSPSLTTSGTAISGPVFDSAISSGAINLAWQEDAPIGASEAGMKILGYNNRNQAAQNSTQGDATFIATGDNGNIMSSLAYDGQIAGAFGPIRKEDQNFADTDSLVMVGSMMNEAFVSQSSTANDIVVMATDRAGSPLVSDIYNANLAGTFRVAKLESSAAVSGDAGNSVLGVRNTSMNATASQGEYQAIATGTAGNVLATLAYDANVAETITPIRLEDVASTTGQAMVTVGGIINDNYSATANDSDYVTNKYNLLGALYVQPAGGRFAGSTMANVISAGTNNSTLVKNTVATLYAVQACNINAAVRYLKIYNKASAPTCGTDTPVMRFVLPVNNCVTASWPTGAGFSTGLGYCIVTGIADADNTATAANEQTVQLTYN